MARFLMNQLCGPKGQFPSFTAHIATVRPFFFLFYKCLKEQTRSASTATFPFLIFNSTVFKRLLPYFLVGGLKREVRDGRNSCAHGCVFPPHVSGRSRPVWRAVGGACVGGDKPLLRWTLHVRPPIYTTIHNTADRRRGSLTLFLNIK